MVYPDDLDHDVLGSAIPNSDGVEAALPRTGHQMMREPVGPRSPTTLGARFALQSFVDGTSLRGAVRHHVDGDRS
jgi:hypothetical protein